VSRDPNVAAANLSDLTQQLVSRAKTGIQVRELEQERGVEAALNLNLQRSAPDPPSLRARDGTEDAPTAAHR